MFNTFHFTNMYALKQNATTSNIYFLGLLFIKACMYNKGLTCVNIQYDDFWNMQHNTINVNEVRHSGNNGILTIRSHVFNNS